MSNIWIWHEKIAAKTVIWVAKKNNSFIDTWVIQFTYHCDPAGYQQNIIKNKIFTFGVAMKKNEVYYHFEQLDYKVFTKWDSESGIGQIIYHSILLYQYIIVISMILVFHMVAVIVGNLIKFKPKDLRYGRLIIYGCVHSPSIAKRAMPLNCQILVFNKITFLSLFRKKYYIFIDFIFILFTNVILEKHKHNFLFFWLTL